MPKQDSKDYILQKTFFLLLTKGYDGVSITDIQKETGISRGLLYHYYGGKEELFREAADKYLVGPFLTNLRETKEYGLSEMIQHVMMKYTEISKQWDDYAGGGSVSMTDYNFLFYQMIQKEKAIEKKYRRMRREEKAAWIEAANTSFSRNEIRSLLPAEKIAAHFILLLDGVWMQSAEKSSLAQYIRMAHQALQDYFELLKA